MVGDAEKGRATRIESPLTRALLWWNAIDLAMSHEMPLTDLVSLVETHLGPERHPVVFEAVTDFVLRVLREHASPEELPDASDPASVWDSNYLFVHHMAATGGATTTPDGDT